VVPPDFEVGRIATLDAIRQEISTAIGDQGQGPYQWLTVAFTADERWV
jgi:predicted Co/Zn/Cd cation transporter (cation efflux family)